MQTTDGKKISLSLFPKSERSYKEFNTNELSQAFCDKINPGRIEAGYPPYKVPRVNRMLQHLDLWDRKAFYASCLEAKNFSGFFHWALKVK